MQLLNYIQEDNVFERILSTLFPPELGSVPHESSVDYHYRISRKGVENMPGYAHGRVVGGAQLKRVFHLPGRTV